MLITPRRCRDIILQLAAELECDLSYTKIFLSNNIDEKFISTMMSSEVNELHNLLE